MSMTTPGAGPSDLVERLERASDRLGYAAENDDDILGLKLHDMNAVDEAAAEIRRLSGLVGEAASLVYRIEAAGHLSYEAQNFLRWKEAARELGPKLRATLAEMGEG